MQIKSPAPALRTIREKLQGTEKPSEIAVLVRETLRTLGYGNRCSLNPFTHTMNGGKIWAGVVCRERNQLLGSIFSNFNRTPLVIRGYPKIKYSEEAGFVGEEVVCEQKIDGTNLIVFLLPNGEFMGKTRTRETWSETREGAWELLFNETGLRNNVERLLRENAAETKLAVCLELYGQKNPGDFVTYLRVEIAFKVIDIIDQNSYTFLPRERVEALCRVHDLPLVAIDWQGTLTGEEIRHLETEILPKRNDVEGFVAKIYATDNQGVTDRFFAKLKTPEIKEKCFTRTETRTVIPQVIIKKAIRKALDEGTPSKDAYDFVVSELAEDAEQSLIDASKDTIERLLKERYRPLSETVCTAALDILNETTEKREALSRLAARFPTMTPRELYQAYVTASNIRNKNMAKPEK